MIARSVEAMVRYRDEVLERAAFQLSRVALEQQSDWQLSGGALSHRSGGFFHVVGLKEKDTGE